jgi:hypothetical protein
MGKEYVINIENMISKEYDKSKYFLTQEEDDRLFDLISKYKIKNNIRLF